MATPCSQAVNEIEAAFYAKCGPEHFTAAARAHLERLIEFSICYAMECSNAADEDWWEDKGSYYWKGRVNTFFDRYLDCPTSDRLIDCQTLQKAVNEYADFVRKAMHRWIKNNKVDDQLRKDYYRSEGPTLGPKDLFKIFAGCPFEADIAFLRLPPSLREAGED